MVLYFLWVPEAPLWLFVSYEIRLVCCHSKKHHLERTLGTFLENVNKSEVLECGLAFVWLSLSFQVSWWPDHNTSWFTTVRNSDVDWKTERVGGGDLLTPLYNQKCFYWKHLQSSFDGHRLPLCHVAMPTVPINCSIVNVCLWRCKVLADATKWNLLDKKTFWGVFCFYSIVPHRPIGPPKKTDGPL